MKSRNQENGNASSLIHTMSEQAFIPALRYHWLTSAYDKLLNLTMPEKQFKNDLLDEAHINVSDKVLDFGIGTATLSLMAYDKQPQATYVGIDVDENILKIAEKKIKAANAYIILEKYNGLSLPFPDNHFNRVISCLVFHHISTEGKRIALLELKRVLKPGGKLIIADFGKPQTNYAKIASILFRWFDGVENTRVNEQGLLPAFIQEAGFKAVNKVRNYNTVFGTMHLLSTLK